MAKGKNFYTKIGITKKDLNEMAGCISAMIFIPIYLIIDLIKMFYSVITNIINFLKQRRITQQEEKNRNYKNDKKITKKQVYHKSKPVFHQSPPLEFRAYKENNYLILENDYFKLKYYELVDSNFIFYYTLKWNNGSYFGGILELIIQFLINHLT